MSNSNDAEHTEIINIEENVNVQYLKIDENHIDVVWNDAKNNPKTDEFLPDFGWNKDWTPLEGPIVQDGVVQSEKEFDKDQLTYPCKTKRSNSIRVPVEGNLLNNDESQKPNINILSSSNSSRSKSKEK